MYRIIYTKQAVKDIKNLKACGLDKKAKELIEIMKKIRFKIHRHMKNWWEICKDIVQEELIFSIGSYFK